MARSSRFSILLVSLMSVGVGCDGSGAANDGGTSSDGEPSDSRAVYPPFGAGLPCDVADVIAYNCLACHADRPLFGALMPLTSHAALIAPSVSEPSIPVYEMMGRRINDARTPMPPPTAGTLDEADRAILEAYIAAMAPMQGSADSCGTPTDGGAPDGSMMGGVGPEFLPCTPTHAITAHALGSDEPFAVPSTADNLYQCFSFASPFAAGSQATAWAPIIDDARVLHHWILYRTSTPQPDGGVMPCSMPSDVTFVMGWAPGSRNTIMPDDVGLELGGPDDYYILQLHYWNVAGYTDAIDQSGVAICTADTRRPEEAGVLWLGTLNIDIPPRTSDHVVTNVCPSPLTRELLGPMTLLSSAPHMHALGTRFVTEIHRAGDPSRVETLVEVDPWDFNTQTTYPHRDMVLNPGDALVTRCTFDNPTDNRVTFGERTEDEMCFNFVTAYPLSALPTDERRACLAF